MYKLIVHKDFLDGKTPVARFRIPIILNHKDVHNSSEAFNKIFTKFYRNLQQEGYLITQPRGGEENGDNWKGNGVEDNIMTFYVAGKTN